MKIKKFSLILLTVAMSLMCAFTGCVGNPDNSSDHSGDSSSGITSDVAVLDGVQITKAPDKVKYIAGESFDKTGMEVAAHYSDGSLKPVTSYFIDKTGALTVADTYVTITYNKYKVQQPITVKAPSLYSIDVESSENAVYRYEAEKQDVSGWAYQSWNTNGFIMEDNAAVSGGKYLGNLSCDYNAQGRYNEVIVTVNSTVEAVGTFSFAYAGGWELGDATFRDGIVMTWNDNEIFIPADKVVATAGWFSYETYELAGLEIKEGVNTFKMKITGNCPNIDYFELEVNKEGVTVDEGLFDVHYCESVCELCGKCTNADCTKPDCETKCLGHHENGCESVCEICGKCTNLDCTKTECVEKCEGHTYGTDLVFKADDTEVSEKASMLFSEWLTGENAPSIEDGRISALYYLYYYDFADGEFTVYAENAVEVELYLTYTWGAATTSLNDLMYIYLGESKVEYTAEATQGSWSDVQTVTLVKLNLAQGVNTITFKANKDCELKNYPNMDTLGLKLHVDTPDTPVADMTLTANDTEVSAKASTLFSEWLTGENAPSIEDGRVSALYYLYYYDFADGEFTVYAENAVEVELYLTYTWGAATTSLNDLMYIYLDGNKVEYTAEATQGSWSDVQTVTLVKLNLAQGVNTITFKANKDCELKNCPNMDTLGLRVVTSQAE